MYNVKCKKGKNLLPHTFFVMRGNVEAYRESVIKIAFPFCKIIPLSAIINKKHTNLKQKRQYLNNFCDKKLKYQ